MSEENWTLRVVGEEEAPIELTDAQVRALVHLGQAAGGDVEADEGEPFLVLEYPDTVPDKDAQAVARGVVEAIRGALSSTASNPSGILAYE